MSTEPDRTTINNPARIFFLAIILTILAAVPRLYNLGGPGFYMDEETTAFASRSMAETGNPQMPSGMPYYRAISQTWLNAISARYFGLDNELSYRLPGTILGILTAPLLFVVARPYLGTSAAFLAALLLALSEWHIITSRQARMYAPFLFFYLACAFSIFNWARTDRLKDLLVSAILFALTVSFHILGVFLACIPLVALYVKGCAKTAEYKLLLFSLIGGSAAYAYGQLFVGRAYENWKALNYVTTTDPVSATSTLQTAPISIVLTAAVITGLVLGIWLARSSEFPDSENGKYFRLVSRYALSILCGTLAAIGHIYAALLAILLLALIYPVSGLSLLKKARFPLAGILFLAGISTIAAIMDHGVVAGLKSLFSFPYPKWILINEISPGITLLFATALLYLAVSDDSHAKRTLSPIALAGLFPLILVGILNKWGGARYLIESYPFILVASVFMLFILADVATHRFTSLTRLRASIIIYAVVLSGILGGHGLIHAYRAGTVEHGDSLNKTALIFPMYPDHKTPGEYVAAQRREGDVVIAEDVLEQKWYAGHVDYWLHQYGPDVGKFQYTGEDGKFHDIYTDSVIATTEIIAALEKSPDRRIWIITSGESHLRREGLTSEQRQWLENIEMTYTPVFTGEDSITKVYCLNCDIR